MAHVREVIDTLPNYQISAARSMPGKTLLQPVPPSGTAAAPVQRCCRCALIKLIRPVSIRRYPGPDDRRRRSQSSWRRLFQILWEIWRSAGRAHGYRSAPIVARHIGAQVDHQRGRRNRVGERLEQAAVRAKITVMPAQRLYKHFVIFIASGVLAPFDGPSLISCCCSSAATEPDLQMTKRS